MSDGLLQDAKQALRGLRRTPGFSLLAISAFALGIAASTSIFCVLDGVLFRPLPLANPSRLYAIHAVLPSGKDNFWSVRNYLDLAEQTRAFQAVGAYYGFEWNVTAGGEAERAHVIVATASLFPALGVAPSLGRSFTTEEDADGGERVAIISDALWRRLLHADPAAVGKFMTMSERQVRVVGVMPPGFRIPGARAADVYTAVRFDAEDRRNRGSHYLRVIGRLAPGVSDAQAQADLRLVASGIAAADPAEHTGWSARAVSLRDQIVGPVARPLQLLLAAVLLLLLIACANVAGLLLARGAARHREIAIRAAVGGSRARIVRQLLAESLLLSAAGGALGLLLAGWSIDALLALAPRTLPRIDEIHLDARVAAFAVLLAIVSGAVAGVWPAVQSSRTDLADALKDGSHASAGARRARARRTLVAGEIALALVLVASAGLTIRSFRRVLDVDLGMRPDGVFKAEIGLPFSRWTDGKRYSDFFLGLEERMSHLPGVESAGLTTLLPLEPSTRDEYGFINDIHVVGHAPEPPGQAISAQLTWVTPGYFKTLAVPIVRGRGFEPASDRWRSAPSVVVNEAFVRRYLRGEEPLGARLNIFNGRFDDHADKWEWTIVGVAKDVKEWGADHDADEEIYIDVAQQPALGMTLVLRTAGDPMSLLPAVTAELHRYDPLVPLSRPGTLEQTLSASLASRRFQMLLLGLFGAAALLLSALGLYGLIATAVAQRTHEFGIRMALGAAPRSLLSLVLRESLGLAGAGVAVGSLVALFATRALKASLYGISSTDPLTWAAVVTLLVVVALLASLLPARRATRVDPAIALRAE